MARALGLGGVFVNAPDVGAWKAKYRDVLNQEEDYEPFAWPINPAG